MTAASDMVTRIALEVNRADDPDILGPITNAIADAYSELAGRRCVFNEKTGAFTTIATLGLYSEATASPGTLPVGIYEVDTALITINSRINELDEEDPNTLLVEYNSAGLTGYPERYAWYGDQLLLYPIPNNAYLISLYYLKALDVETWAANAEQLVRCCAKKNLYLHYLNNADKAAAMGVSEQNALRALRRKSAGRQGSGYVQAQD
jgi:hypothetical protein